METSGEISCIIHMTCIEVFHGTVEYVRGFGKETYSPLSPAQQSHYIYMQGNITQISKEMTNFIAHWQMVLAWREFYEKPAKKRKQAFDQEKIEMEEKKKTCEMNKMNMSSQKGAEGEQPRTGCQTPGK